MLLDIIMESLMNMDDETLNYVMESMSADELDIVNNYIANETASNESDDDYASILESAVYELNSMSDADACAVLESLDDNVIDDLITMESAIIEANESAVISSIRDKVLAQYM